MEIKAVMLQVPVDAAREVLRRSRITFLTSVIVSLSLFISSFNAHWSWYRRWPLQHDEWAESDVVQKLQESVYGEWAKSRYITIAPLGIQVGSRDAVPLGALTLLLVSAWSFGCVRRHTYVIRQLLLDTREETLDVRRGVYHGIAAQRLYSEVTGIDEPTTRMDGRTERAGYAHVVQSGIRWLPYLPTLMIGLLLIMDIGSIYWEPAPLRENHQTLMEEFCIDAGLACDSG